MWNLRTHGQVNQLTYGCRACGRCTGARQNIEDQNAQRYLEYMY